MPWPPRSSSFPWECPQGVAIPRTGHSSPLLGPVQESAIFLPGKGSRTSIPAQHFAVHSWGQFGLSRAGSGEPLG